MHPFVIHHKVGCNGKGAHTHTAPDRRDMNMLLLAFPAKIGYTSRFVRVILARQDRDGTKILKRQNDVNAGHVRGPGATWTRMLRMSKKADDGDAGSGISGTTEEVRPALYAWSMRTTAMGKMDTLGLAFRMRSGCDTTTQCALCQMCFLGSSKEYSRELVAIVSEDEWPEAVCSLDPKNFRAIQFRPPRYEVS